MKKFMLCYHGGSQPKTKEEGTAHGEKWHVWIKGLGDAVVNPGTPLPYSMLMTTSGAKEDMNPDGMKGFAVVKAEDMEAALKIAEDDPFLDMGGTIRVSEMMEMGY